VPTGDEGFDDLVAPLRKEFDKTDPRVEVILSDGTVIHFAHVDSGRLSLTLATVGWARLEDSVGSKITLFAHGVSAVVSRKDAD
jgi:hypothetical protein